MDPCLPCSQSCIRIYESVNVRFLHTTLFPIKFDSLKHLNSYILRILKRVWPSSPRALYDIYYIVHRFLNKQQMTIYLPNISSMLYSPSYCINFLKSLLNSYSFILGSITTYSIHVDCQIRYDDLLHFFLQLCRIMNRMRAISILLKKTRIKLHYTIPLSHNTRKTLKVQCTVF